MITNLFLIIFWFFVCWFGGFYLHELCHKYECERQGGKGKISIWYHNHIPSMLCSCTGAKNYNLFALAGGLYAGILLMILAGLAYVPMKSLFIGAFLCGLVNLGYCIYEWKYLYIWDRKKYMKWHYRLYAVLLVIGIFLLRNEIAKRLFI